MKKMIEKLKCRMIPCMGIMPHKLCLMLCVLLTPYFASAAGLGTFRTGIGGALGLGALLAFLMCVYFVVEAIKHARAGQSFGNDIVVILITAGGFVITGYLFTVFGLSGAVVEPTFD